MSGGPDPLIPFGVVVLAAGQSTRMGSPKLLLEWEGRSLLRRAVKAALESGASEVVVVLGGYAEQLRQEIPTSKARVVLNPDYAAGQSTSLRAGIAALGLEVEGAVCYPADQPFVTPAVIRRLVEIHARARKPIVLSEGGGVRGAPMFFARELFPELARIQGDQGGRDLVRSHPESTEVVHFEDRRLMLDVDTAEDYQQLLAEAESDGADGAPGSAHGA